MKHRHQRNSRILQHTINHKVAEMNKISISPCGTTFFEKIRFIVSYAEDWQIYSIINLFLIYYGRGNISFTIRPDHSIYKHLILYGTANLNGYLTITITKSILSIQIKTKGGREQIVSLKIVRN